MRDLRGSKKFDDRFMSSRRRIHKAHKRRRRLFVELLEERRVLSALGLTSNLLADDGSGNPGGMISSPIAPGQRFFVEILAEDLRASATPKGVIGVGVNVGWNDANLDGIDSPFNAVDVVTSDFPIIPQSPPAPPATLDNSASPQITDLVAGSLPNAGPAFGTAIGATGPERFALLHLEAGTSGSANFEIIVLPTQIAFADGTPFDPGALSVTNPMITVGSGNQAPVVNDQMFSVSANATNGTSVGTVVAMDPDTDPLTFQITGGTGDAALDINPNTGEITVADSGALGGVGTLTLDVTVSDGTDSDDATITVNVLGQSTLSINDVTVTESGLATFTIQLQRANDSVVGVTVMTEDITALASSDYTAIPMMDQRITFGSTVTERTVTVQTTEDSLVEGNEQFRVSLSLPDNATIVDGEGIATIQDNDTATLSIQTPVTVTENGGSQNVAVTLTTTDQDDNPATLGPGITLTADVTDAGGGTATSGDDYTAIGTQSVSFSAGDAGPKTISIVPDDDNTVERDETVNLSLGNLNDDVDGRASIGTASSVVTITDNDDATFTINSPTSDEDGNLTFTISLDNPIDTEVVVDTTYSGGNAQGSGTDYDSASDSATFLANSTTSQMVTVAVTDDNVVEATETFMAAISSATALNGRDVSFGGPGIGTINDNDSATFTITGETVNESSGSLTFTIEPNAPIDIDIDVDVTYANGSATGSATGVGADFNNTPGMVTFDANNVSAQQVTVDITDDNVTEGMEDFTAMIASSTALNGRDVTVSDSATGTIVDTGSVATFTIEDSTVNEADGTMTFTISLDNEIDIPVGIVVSYENGTATGAAGGTGADFDNQSDMVTFPVNNTDSQQVTVAITNDNLSELTETFTARLSISPSTDLDGRVVNTDDMATGTITEDTSDVAIFSIDDVTANEMENTLDFTLSLTNPLDIPVDIVVSYQDIDTQANDFDHSPTTVRFDAGDTADKTVSVPLMENAGSEPDESFTARLAISPSTPVGSRPVDTSDTGTGTIVEGVVLSIADVTVDEGGVATFRVMRSGSTSSRVSVRVDTMSGTADQPADYQVFGQRVAIEMNQTLSEPISIQTESDSLVEGDEQFFVVLTNPDNATIGRNQAVGTITDEDITTVSISATNPDAAEPNNDGEFTVSLDNGVAGTDIVVMYSISGSASNSIDYETITGSVTIHENESTATIDIEVRDDQQFEGSETVVLQLTGTDNTSVTPATGSDRTATATIADNDQASVSIEANDAIAAEPNNDGQFTVRLDDGALANGDLTVMYTISGSAANGNDYDELTGMVTITDRTNSAIIDVLVDADNFVESTETVILTLSGTNDSNVVPATGIDNTATVTIADDDETTVSITANDASAIEASDNGQFTVSLDNGKVAGTNIDVTYSVNGTATNGDDYTMLDGIVRILANQSSATIDVDVLQDALVEGNETVLLTLTNTDNDDVSVADPPNRSDTVTISDDDTATVSIVASDPNATEANDNGQFTVSLSEGQIAGRDIVVSYSIGGTASNGNDYETLTGMVTIPEGQNAAPINVLVESDDVVEDDESVTLTLDSTNVTGVSAATGSAGTATVTVTEDSGDVATLMISAPDSSIIELDSGSPTATFLVTLVGRVDGDVRVDFTTNDGTATSSDNDYQSDSGTLVFPASSDATQTMPITIDVVGDRKVESDEGFAVQLSNIQAGGRNVIFADSQADVAAAVIQNDDAATVSINDVSMLEGNSGTKNFVFTVTLSHQVDRAVTVDFATADGSATVSNNDYEQNSDMLTFQPTDTPGPQTRTVSVEVNGDTNIELMPEIETFTVNLSNLQVGNRDVSITESRGTGGIIDDDGFDGVLSGTVFADRTNDGVQDSFEFGIPGVIITLRHTTDSGTTEYVAMTDGDGEYSFINLSRLGTYEILETQPAGNFGDGIDTIGTQGGDTANDRFFNIDLLNAPSEIGVGNNFADTQPPGFFNKRMFLSSTPPIPEVYRELNALAAEAAGDPLLAEQIREGSIPSRVKVNPDRDPIDPDPTQNNSANSDPVPESLLSNETTGESELLTAEGEPPLRAEPEAATQTQRSTFVPSPTPIQQTSPANVAPQVTEAPDTSSTSSTPSDQPEFSSINNAEAEQTKPSALQQKPANVAQPEPVVTNEIPAVEQEIQHVQTTTANPVNEAPEESPAATPEPLTAETTNAPEGELLLINAKRADQLFQQIGTTGYTDGAPENFEEESYVPESGAAATMDRDDINVNDDEAQDDDESNDKDDSELDSDPLDQTI